MSKALSSAPESGVAGVRNPSPGPEIQVYAPGGEGQSSLLSIVLPAPGTDTLLLWPGFVAALFGLTGSAVLSLGPVSIGPLQLTFYTQALAGALWISGLAYAYLGIIAKMANDLSGETVRRWRFLLDYTRTVFLSFGLVFIGLVLDLWFVAVYVSHGLRVLPDDTLASHLSTTGLFLIVVGFMTFSFTLVVHAVGSRLENDQLKPNSLDDSSDSATQL
jgi:hypothetical protein